MLRVKIILKIYHAIFPHCVFIIHVLLTDGGAGGQAWHQKLDCNR